MTRASGGGGRVVIAVEDHDGSVVYAYGYVDYRGVETSGDRDIKGYDLFDPYRRLPDMQYETTVHWLNGFTWTRQYPSQEDFDRPKELSGDRGTGVPLRVEGTPAALES